ncbi:protein HGV2-like [Centruroides sculpturatus]|uniref:protein HGV2-like n=1 Tax=Centruroides sculpturatus TaxID=218467 RepID=UPI000C6EF8A2|nr:protein HGV2-like [Centruroides sculpturatus]
MSSNTSSPNKMDSNGSQAMNHLVQGKRHMLVQDYSSAVYSLQESCQLFGKHYGETANECGEAYFCYGKALLELARAETGVLGNALPGDSGEEEEEGEATDTEEGENTEKSAEDKDDDKEDEKEDDDEDNDNEEEVSEEESEKTCNLSPDSTSQTGDPTEPGSSSGAQKEEKEDEISNLQLAWEVLELAKLIFKRQSENKAMQLKTADVLLKLGEVSIESENYKQAVEDLSECLELQTKLLNSDDRQIAETHYQLGLAHSFDNQFDDAISSFRNAMSVIELRISNLKQLVKESGRIEKPLSDLECIMSIADDDPVTKAMVEIKELEAIIPDIKTKIEDMEDLKKNTQEALIEATLQKMEEVC